MSYQLGDWVEFERVVGKQETDAGSTPVSQRLSRRRRGMVIGVRNVHDVTATGGAVPQLANPREVLIVAISLHRSYKVFPGDTVASGPPPPRRSRRASVPSDPPLTPHARKCEDFDHYHSDEVIF